MIEKKKHVTTAQLMLGLQAGVLASIAWWLYANGQPVIAFFCAVLSVVFAMCIALVRTWVNMGQFGGVSARSNKPTPKH